MKKTILFQGDSITDAGRDRGSSFDLGKGYPLLASATLGMDNPEKYTIYNRGISGNRIVDVYARIKQDIINLKPDYMSLLIGVNDVWHEICGQNGVDTPKFEKIYTMLIEEIKLSLPDIKLMILEPYVLEGTATENTEEAPDKLERFRTGVAEKAAAAKRVAERFGIKFIPLQAKFDEALSLAPASFWLGDGVHPTFYGHELISREWLKGFLEL